MKEGTFSSRTKGTGEAPVSWESGENMTPVTQAVANGRIFRLVRVFSSLQFCSDTSLKQSQICKDTLILRGKVL